ncbi:MAG: hypothetical protein JW724_06190 [Candidatus Altiarchaeota archaeon]|nr:hypothetical protein [Candidatus Altiarchaeota archaeon]
MTARSREENTKLAKPVFLFLFLALPVILTCGCESYAESDDINGLFTQNDLSISMKIEENGSPPSSETQETYDDRRTFEETFETLDGEDSFMLTLLSTTGTFYIREIAIERID